MKGFIRFITFLVFFGIILLAFLFAVNNTTVVTLWLGMAMPPVSVGVLVICTFILGGLLGLVLGMGIFRQLKYVLKIRQLKSELEKNRQFVKNSHPPGRKG